MIYRLHTRNNIITHNIFFHNNRPGIRECIGRKHFSNILQGVWPLLIIHIYVTVQPGLCIHRTARMKMQSQRASGH